MFKGVTLGAVNITDGTIGCVAVRRDSSNNVTVYGSSAIQSSLPLTPAIGPINVPGAWGSSPLVLGDAANSLRGVFSELLVYSRALTDAELVREMDAIRGEMNARGITP